MTRTRIIDRQLAYCALEKFLEQKKMRRTNERSMILDQAIEMKGHFTIDELCEQLENNAYHVSRATVYNTVQVLREAGLLRRHRFVGQPSQYEIVVEAAQTNHHHLICQVCGKVKEIKDAAIDNHLRQTAYRGFHPEYFTLYVYGICSGCKRRKRSDAPK
ncbi:MAG: transcriptional repressor [Muribaculaceae bacterium]|nr:transcriptional repressor [Muribaculaceae bacterium]